jgi:peptidoglycan/LPS O-acetylase OafA/YrhL
VLLRHIRLLYDARPHRKIPSEASTYFVFISNRFLRLYPAYAAVLVVIGLGNLARFPGNKSAVCCRLQSINKIDWSSAIFLIGSQLIMWGQDLYLFVTLKGGALVFWHDFHTAPQPLYALSIIPQAWTLGLEFSFYLIAPFIVRRPTYAIVLAFVASLALRVFLQFCLGYQGDRFFPSEFVVFLVGTLGYRLYKLPSIASDKAVFATFILRIVCLSVALLINRWHGVSRLASICFWTVAVGAIPFLFRVTKDNRFDRYLGKLS